MNKQDFIYHNSSHFNILHSMLLVLLILFAVTALFPQRISAAENGRLKTVRLCVDDSNLFFIKNTDGIPVGGYAYEYIHHIASYAGWKVEYVLCGGFSDCIQALAEGKVDLMYDVSYSKEREKYCLYPDSPMGSEDYFLYCLAENTELHSDDYSTYNKKTVGVSANTIEIEALHQWCQDNNVKLNIREFASVSDKEEALKAGTIDMDFEISMLANNSYSALTKISGSSYYLAANTKRKDLIADINNACRRIKEVNPFFVENLNQKYFSKSILNRTLSTQEDRWVRNHNTLRIGYMDNYLPFSGQDDKGNPTGIVKDIIPLLLRAINLENRLSVRYIGYADNTDMFAALAKDDIDIIFPIYGNLGFGANNGASISANVINLSADLAYTGSFSEKTTASIAVNKNNMLQEYYTKVNYPKAKIIYCNTIDDALNAVIYGKAGSTILNGMRTAHVLADAKYKTLTTIRLSQPFSFSFAVKEGNSTLLSLFNRAIISMDEGFAFNYVANYITPEKTSFIQLVKEDAPYIIGFLLLTLAAITFMAVSLHKSRKKLAVTRFVDNKLFEGYDAIYIVNLNSNEISTVKPSNILEIGNFSDKADYTQTALQFAEITAPQYKQDWISFSNPDYMKQYMADQNSREYVYELPNAEQRMHRCTINVLERINGEASTLLLSFTAIDDVSAKTLILQKQLAEQSVFTQYFLKAYDSAYYIGLLDYSWQVYKRSDIMEAKYSVLENYIVSLERYINTEVHPEDRDTVSILIKPAELHDRILQQQSFSFIFRKISEPQFKFFKCEITRGADENHAAIGFKDITEDFLKKQEQKIISDLAKQQRHIKAFGSMINAALWNIRISSDDQIAAVHWSNEFRKMLGFDETEEDFPNTVEAWSSRLHPEDSSKTLEHFNNSIKSKETSTFVYDIEYRILRKDSSCRWYRAVGRIENNEDGTRNFYGIIYDISADKQLIEQQSRLKEALALAQSANRAKTTFLNNMSHDIRTPMNAIIGYTGLAASHIASKEQVLDYLSKISQSSEHLLSLINDILDMSRIESGKMNLSEKEENLSDIIHTLRNIIQADIHSKQLDFYVDAVAVNNEDIICDKLRLNQILLNILSNSIKYTAAGGTVTMRITEKAVKDNGYAAYEFCIKDNGMGMSEEFLKTIFDPFTRVQSSTVSRIQGTGLGMAITKNIVDMMNGSIDIQSTPGKGTQVIISLDFKLQDTPKTPKEISELKGIRALVADDDSNTCLSVCSMLEDIGMNSEWCTSGKEAVIRAEAAVRKGNSFRVYIIDWIMPDMNGIETTRRIRSVIGDDSPIIILTAYDWSDIENEARAAGVTAFVSKPMFPSDLHKVLSSCIEDKPEEISAENTCNFSGKKILLVDDNDINREIAQEILTEHGFIIDTAEDGDIAVEKIKAAQNGDYNIILMDIQMPRMNGYEATKQIRALGTDISKIPILAMTANAFEEDRMAAFDAGMNEHISKPINIKKLLEALARFI